MFDSRLLGLAPEARRFIVRSVILQVLSLVANVVLIIGFGLVFSWLLSGTLGAGRLVVVIVLGLSMAGIRSLCIRGAARFNFQAAQVAKRRIRHRLYAKLVALGPGYSQEVATAEAVQLASEGVEQLETYFGAFLPQFFYALLAPLVLFGVMSAISFEAALILLLGVPLIPLSIVLVQRLARRVLARYWGKYTALGDSFLENLQGLTTLKIYSADGARHAQMNREAEDFRRATMRVLSLQLNSIVVMDLVAYGGAALGILVAIQQSVSGAVSLAGGLILLLLAADFFIPLRQLGSFFHVAMNGAAAARKMFRLLDMETPPEPSPRSLPPSQEIRLEDVHFAYTPAREILHGLRATLDSGRLTAVVGESGCGKSTLAGLINGRLRGYEGTIRLGGVDLREVGGRDLSKWVTTVSFTGYLFRGTVADNLRMARPEARDEEMEHVLRDVGLWDEIAPRGGLELQIENEGSNLSGGQRQRLNLARALLHDSPVYIFDEATSSVDVEAEHDILRTVYDLATRKTVILITHRLQSAQSAHRILVLEEGRIAQSGRHEELVVQDGPYRRMWKKQSELLRINQEEEHGAS